MLRLLLIALITSFCAIAAAQPYPNRAIKLIVGFPPGGSNDFVARALQPKLAEYLGQPVVVENKGGASGIIAAEYVARQPNDGYTLLLASYSMMTMYPVFYSKLPYDALKDFAPIGTTTSNLAQVLAVHDSVPAKTLKEFVAYAKSNPGAIAAGAPNPGSINHLYLEQFKAQAGIDMVIVTYKGSGPTVNDLLANQIQLVMELPVAVMPHFKSGRVRPLAVTGKTRLPSLPHIPTLAEEGFTGFDMRGWHGLLAPAGTSPAVVEMLSHALAKALTHPDVRSKLASHEVEPALSTPTELAARIQSERERWSRFATETGFKID